MKKKKILLFSDDMRMSSGVGTMSREIIVGTAHHFDWVQVGGAIKHPEEGKMFDLRNNIYVDPKIVYNTGDKTTNLTLGFGFRF